MSEAHGTLSGRLSKDRFGSSMPVDAPYYQSPPFYYRDARAMAITFETDDEAAAEMLLPVQKLLGGVFSRTDFTLPHGRVIKSY